MRATQDEKRQTNPAEPEKTSLFERVKRAFRQFLIFPTILVVIFLALAGVSFWLDQAQPAWLQAGRDFLQRYFFNQAQSTADFVSTLTTGMMTVTSITITMLLLVLQQTASTLGHQVVDQFLHRRINQVFFGFFVGTVLFNIATLTTVQDNFNPVFGATLSGLSTMTSIYLLVLLLYGTITQIRPTAIIKAIHDNMLRARLDELPLVRGTRREVQFNGQVKIPVKSQHNGFANDFDLKHMGKAIRQAQGEVEVELLLLMGSYVAYGDTIAWVRAWTEEDAVLVGDAVQNGIRLEEQRNIECDPNYGLQQLEMIAWTSISTAKQNPEPGLLAVRAIRDAVGRWLDVPDMDRPRDPLPIVYYDNIYTRVMDTLQAIGVISSESLQFQNYTELMRTFAVLYGRLPADLQDRTDTVILRLLPALGDHVLTGELDATLSLLVRTLHEAGHDETAQAVQRAQTQMSATVGYLNSRGTRANFHEKHKDIGYTRQ